VALVAQEIPKVGLVMENGRLVRWLKNVGDPVRQGEPLLELETEKTVVEIAATVTGILVQALLEVDQEARVGDQIAWVETGETGERQSPTAAPPIANRNETAGEQRITPSAVAASPVAPSPVAPSPVASSSSAARIRSSPVARKFSAEHGVDLATLVGTGPRGRVQLEDVRRAAEAQSAKPLRASSFPAGAVTQELSSMRRAVARAMTLSNAIVPQFMVARAIDWTSVQALRSDIHASKPADSHRLSVNDFLLQAVARALADFPAMNATFSGDPATPEARIVRASGAHIGLVVALEHGLLVPVIHDVDKSGLLELARRRSDCVQRAATGRLKQEELEGATVSISNLGPRGPDRFTAMINPPQSAILAVGRQRDCVVAIKGIIQVRPISDLTLTVDHRVADGQLASDFLAKVVEILEGGAWHTA
jgi:pyruvate dehydrogenase E2 component (dihydrolipoamide acetyltransferase)